MRNPSFDNWLFEAFQCDDYFLKMWKSRAIHPYHVIRFNEATKTVNSTIQPQHTSLRSEWEFLQICFDLLFSKCDILSLIRRFSFRMYSLYVKTKPYTCVDVPVYVIFQPTHHRSAYKSKRKKNTTCMKIFKINHRVSCLVASGDDQNKIELENSYKFSEQRNADSTLYAL